MKKEQLLQSIVKEMKVSRRLSTKIPAGQLDFRPKENVRSTLELLQYLSWCSTGMLRFWMQNAESDFRAYFGHIVAEAKTLSGDQFLAKMDEQIDLLEKMFATLTEEELDTRLVTLPWGDKLPLRQALVETSLKWTTAYKLQLFFYLRLCSDQKLGTPDAWRLTEIETTA
ncbi:MAG TPA: hypothetical protein VGO45_05960 [Bacteroidia bacterium]|jgi:hypothetical protein|nr:hypothetical protein [Bacteroidia bacterium]